MEWHFDFGNGFPFYWSLKCCMWTIELAQYEVEFKTVIRWLVTFYIEIKH